MNTHINTKKHARKEAKRVHYVSTDGVVGYLAVKRKSKKTGIEYSKNIKIVKRRRK